MNTHHPSEPDSPFPGAVPPRPPGGGAPPGLFARFGRLFTSPRTAFHPPLGRAVWLVPLSLLALMQLSQGYLLRDLTREQFISGIERSERLTEEQRQTMITQMESAFEDPQRLLLQSLWGVMGAMLVSYVLTAALYHLGINFGLGGRVRFGETLGVTAFTGLVFLVREAIRLPLMLSKETLYVFTGPAAFVDPENRLLITLCDRLDLFSLFRLVLLAYGLASISGLRVSRTVIPVLAVWALAGILGVLFMLSPVGRMFG